MSDIPAKNVLKTVNIKLYVSELIFDIQNKAYLTGRSRQSADNPKTSADMQASDDDNEQIKRSIGNAFATLKTVLAEYLIEDGTTATNELDTDSTELNLELSVPSNYNYATTETLTAAAHQYVTNIALADWFTITNKADASDYAKLANDSITVINEAVNKRVRPTRTAPTSE